MGISANVALMFMQEHSYKPFRGAFLSIGRQSVSLTPQQAMALVSQQCGQLRGGHSIEIDDQTRGASGGGYITDRSFYSLFADITYSCLDISDYEGADIVWDLGNPVPEEWEARYDLIFNGSCLDNLFDPATAVKNISRMLKPGGRVIHIEHLTRSGQVPNPYVCYSAGWFHDYYALNEFDDCKVYVAMWKTLTDPVWRLYLYDPLPDSGPGGVFFGHDQHFDPAYEAGGYIIAEKGVNSTWQLNPVQSFYRQEADEPYRRGTMRFSSSPRPIASFAGEVPPQHPQYRPCGIVTWPD